MGQWRVAAWDRCNTGIKPVGGLRLCLPHDFNYLSTEVRYQQGVVDGAENNPPSFYLSGHYQVCKFYSIDEHTMIPDILLASTHMWNSLKPYEQKWLQEAINKSIPYQRELWIKSENESLQAIIEAGVEVNYPKKINFQNATQQMNNEFKKDPEMAKLIKRIRDEAD